MALTPFGKALRRLRIDRDMLLKDMAQGASLTPAFLSAIEAGRKPIPRYLVDRIADSINLGKAERASLRSAAEVSASSVEIGFSKTTSTFDRSLAVQLARSFDNLSESQKNAIKEIMDRRKS